MDLRLDPLQQRLREAVDTVLTGTGDPSAQLAAIGVPALNAPEDLGGLALGLAADAVVNERLGYALEPLGAYRATAHALDLLDHCPGDTLAELYAGERHAVVIGAHGPATVRVDADGRLRGTSEPLPRAAVALCVVRAAGDDGTTGWYLAHPHTGPVTVEPTEHFGLPATRVRFDGAAAQPLTADDDRTRRALGAARLRQAALLLGMADRAVDVARAHVNTRIQSGKPLVERQTVAHRLALLMGEADGWRLLLHRAAWDHDRGGHPAAAAVLAVAAEHAQSACRTALQLHGVRGMLAHSTAATAYRLITAESVRLGRPDTLWLEAADAT
ncbi:MULTISPECIES: acyl-CoA dehydrogenase family protein [unclassified Kitasatospora]